MGRKLTEDKHPNKKIHPIPLWTENNALEQKGGGADQGIEETKLTILWCFKW